MYWVSQKLRDFAPTLGSKLLQGYLKEFWCQLGSGGGKLTGVATRDLFIFCFGVVGWCRAGNPGAVPGVLGGAPRRGAPAAAALPAATRCCFFCCFASPFFFYPSFFSLPFPSILRHMTHVSQSLVENIPPQQTRHFVTSGELTWSPPNIQKLLSDRTSTIEIHERAARCTYRKLSILRILSFP